MRNKILLALIVLIAGGFIYSIFFKKKPTEIEEPLKPLITVQQLNTTVIKEYLHDTSAFTEGLEFYKGQLYESAGREGLSFLTKYDVGSTIKGTKKKITDKTIFAEGITILRDTIYQLTYTNNIVIKYNANSLEVIGTMPWKYGQGWGLANNGTNLIASNSTSVIYFLNPSDLSMVRNINVNENNSTIDAVNELEYVDGFIYANEYTTDNIYKIDAANGSVVAKANFKNIFPEYNSENLSNTVNQEKVLNGIAYNPTTKTFFITGKNWPKMFEVKF
jgi:glutaminyl-peptide cyclotransferase